MASTSRNTRIQHLGGGGSERVVSHLADLADLADHQSFIWVKINMLLAPSWSNVARYCAAATHGQAPKKNAQRESGCSFLYNMSNIWLSDDRNFFEHRRNVCHSSKINFSCRLHTVESFHVYSSRTRWQVFTTTDERRLRFLEGVTQTFYSAQINGVKRERKRLSIPVMLNRQDSAFRCWLSKKRNILAFLGRMRDILRYLRRVEHSSLYQTFLRY